MRSWSKVLMCLQVPEAGTKDRNVNNNVSLKSACNELLCQLLFQHRIMFTQL